MVIETSIAFLCHPYHRGGVTKWMADASAESSRQGNDVYLITVIPQKPFISSGGCETILELIKREYPLNNLKIISCNVDWEFEFGTEAYKAHIYSNLIRQTPIGTSVILSDDTSVWKAAAYNADKYPMIGVMHGDAEIYYQLGEKYSPSLSCLIAVSNRIKQNFINKYNGNFDHSKLLTIPCGIPLNSLNRNQKINKENILELIFVGRIGEYPKRTSDLVKISKELQNEHIPFHLNIIGDGKDKSALEANVMAQGLSNNITFHGWQSPGVVSSFLLRSHILLLTSQFEGMPLVVMEAFAAGCGVVSSRVSGVEDLEAHKDCLEIFPVGDIKQAIEGIKNIMKIPDIRRISYARQLAESEFSIESCMKKYLHAIKINTGKEKSEVKKLIEKSSSLDRYISKVRAIFRLFKIKMDNRIR